MKERVSMMRRIRSTLVAASALLAINTGSALAQLDGHGPDAWRVSGVAADDVLNIRMGPGTDYLVIGRFGPNEHGLQMVTCVPYLTPAIHARMSESQRANLPSRWCLMRSTDLSQTGWVAQRFLAEDGAIADKGAPSGFGDPVVEAEALVRRLYEARIAASSGQGVSPLSPGRASDYFFASIAQDLVRNPPGADPLLDSQDFDGALLSVMPDPEQPMLQGMITVLVRFSNFGVVQQSRVRLRADTSQPGAPIRIFAIDHPSWTFPQR